MGLTNILLSGKQDIIPEVGMGATILLWTDRHACTIIEISKSGKTLKIQQDNAIRTDDRQMSDAQDYRYERDPNGPIYEVRQNKQGKWKTLKSKYSVRLGTRDEYYDYSF